MGGVAISALLLKEAEVTCKLQALIPDVRVAFGLNGDIDEDALAELIPAIRTRRYGNRAGLDFTRHGPLADEYNAIFVRSLIANPEREPRQERSSGNVPPASRARLIDLATAGADAAPFLQEAQCTNIGAHAALENSVDHKRIGANGCPQRSQLVMSPHQYISSGMPLLFEHLPSCRSAILWSLLTKVWIVSAKPWSVVMKISTSLPTSSWCSWIIRFIDRMAPLTGMMDVPCTRTRSGPDSPSRNTE